MTTTNAVLPIASPAYYFNFCGQPALSTVIMPRTPEQDALTKNWATINSALANQVDLTEFGNFLVQHEFLPQQSVNNILSGGQNFTKLTSLTRGVQSRIVTASSPSRTAQYYKSFVLLVHDDLHLTGLAQEMVDACKYFYGKISPFYILNLVKKMHTVL